MSVSSSSPDLPPALPPFPTRRSSDLYTIPQYCFPTIPRSAGGGKFRPRAHGFGSRGPPVPSPAVEREVEGTGGRGDRKSTRLNSSHVSISYAVFCLKKKKKRTHATLR